MLSNAKQNQIARISTLHLLLLTNSAIIVVALLNQSYRFADWAIMYSPLLYGGLAIFGAISAFVGIWIAIRKFREKHYPPVATGFYLVIFSVIVTFGSLFYLWVLFAYD